MDMRQNNRAVGETYERKAAAYLKSLGYEIIEYNFRCRQGEIDIIAKDGEYLVFCEVKYRSGTKAGTPMEAVDYKKQRIISRCELVYITKKRLGEIPCRFDVVSVTDQEIHILKNAFDYVG